MTGVSIYSAVDLIEIQDLILDVYSAQAFMTGDVISSGALLRSVFKLFKLGHLEIDARPSDAKILVESREKVEKEDQMEKSWPNVRKS